MAHNLPPDFCPYKGLQPYTLDDRAFFFGRERDSEIIISNLYAAPLTILYGASGVGKSSVLQASVVPQLTQTPRLVVVAFHHWQGENFLTTLKTEVLAAVGRSTGKAVDVNVKLPLDELIQQCSAILRGSIFFVLDQFEEYFLYHPASDIEEAFDVELARAVNRSDINVSFVFSMREDGLSKLDRFQGRIPNLLNNLLRLEHLDRHAATDAIRKPLDEYNRRLPGNQGAVSIEDGLVEAVLEGVQTGKVNLELVGRGELDRKGQDAGDNVQIETPFLQMVLMRLWEEERSAGSQVLRLATLERLGGPENIARTHLDKQMQTLSPAEREMAAQLFRYLVTPSGTKIAQESVALAAWTNLDEKKADVLLNELSAPDMRILRTVSAPGQPVRFEMFHDVLARAVLSWQARRRLARERARVKRWRVGGLLLTLALMMVCLGAVYGYNHNETQRQIAKANRIAKSATSEADPELRLMLAVEAVKVRRTPEAEAQLRAALRSPLRAVLRGHVGPVRSAVFSPDGAMIATASEDDTTQVFQVSKWRTLVHLDHPDHVMNVTFSPDGKLLVTACADGNARVFAVGNWSARPAVLTGHMKSIRSVAFSPDSRLMVTASEDKSAIIWQHSGDTWPKLTALNGPQGHTNFVQTAAFSHDGQLVVTASRDNTVKIWKVSTGKVLQTLSGGSVMRGAVFGPGDKSIVAGNEACEIKIWRLDGGKWILARTLPETDHCKDPEFQRGFIDAVNFSPNGQFLVTPSRDGTVWVRNTETWEMLKPALAGHTQEVYYAAYDPDSKLIVSASEDGTVFVWEPRFSNTEVDASSIDELLILAKKRMTTALDKDQRLRYQLDAK
jgi:WD40 repeat protein